METGVQRLEAQDVHLFPAVGTVGTGSGFICIPLEPASGAVYELETPAGIGGVGRFHSELEESERIRVSPVQSDPPMLDQDQEGQSGRADGNPSVAVPAVVANDFGAVLSAGPHFDTERGPVAGRDGHQPPTPSARVPPVGRMDLIRRRYENRGLSEGVVQLLLASNRETTSATYKSAWNVWFHWCSKRSENPLSPTLNFILKSLSDLFEEGKAYRSINVYRSMLSGTLEKIEGWDVGKHPLVVKLMQGIFNSSPPKPKYTGFWSTDTVLDYIESLGPDSGLSLTVLSKKLVILLALTSLFRVSEIASIDFSSMVFSGPAVKFALSKLRKSQTPSSAGAIFSLKKLTVLSNVCPVSCLDYYCKETLKFRNDSNSNLMLSIKSPHAPIGASAVAKWMKDFLGDAGIDTLIYSAHSTRGAAASKAVATGLSIETILRSGNWSSESVFAKHYSRPIEKESVASQVLGGASGVAG
jgi:hypothetical protein